MKRHTSRKHAKKHNSPVLLLLFLISAVALSIALGNAPASTTGEAVRSLATTPAPLFNCATNIPCDNTFAGTRACQAASDRYAQQGNPNVINCVNHCCIITPQ